MAAFSPALAAADRDIKTFLFARLYRHPAVQAVRDKAAEIVRDLFARLSRDPGLMPDEWAAGLTGPDDPRTPRRVADFIAGMTDNYAVSQHRRLFPGHARPALGDVAGRPLRRRPETPCPR